MQFQATLGYPRLIVYKSDWVPSKYAIWMVMKELKLAIHYKPIGPQNRDISQKNKGNIQYGDEKYSWKELDTQKKLMYIEKTTYIEENS